MADVQMSFGSFLAFYLAGLGWSKQDVGLALTVGAAAGVIVLIPGGALADAVRWKRGLAAAGVVMIAIAALILALWPRYLLVFAAEILHGATAGVVGPALAAISLGLVGRNGMSLRVGRNYRFSAAGNVLTAAVMGGIGNLTGAFVGGMMIGILSAFSDFFFDPRWTQPVVFALLILTLVFRPAGILGQVVREKV